MPRRKPKLERPEVHDAFVNQRLHARLDRDLESAGVLWIGAPAGSGKTTLLSSYVEAQGQPCLWYQLDRSDRDPASLLANLADGARALLGRRASKISHGGAEYATDVEAFARHFFTELYRRLPDGSLVVFDNAQLFDEVAESAALLSAESAALLSAATEACEGPVRLVFLSRHAPPEVLAKLQSQRRMAVLSWPELQLSDDEARELLCHIDAPLHSRQRTQRLNQLAEGWAAGLVLLASHADELPDSLSERVDLAPQVVFDYFSGELFHHLADEDQQFLIAISLLPEMTAAMAQQLGGRHHARALLERLCREQLFVLKHQRRPVVYQLHPLFRNYLRYRLRLELKPEHYGARCRTAAALLEQHGAIHAAGELLDEQEEAQVKVEFILRHAETLSKQGSLETLQHWLETIPRELYDGEPWLDYWAGVARLPQDTVTARQHFERCFERFVAARQRTGTYLSWARIVESIIFEAGNYAGLDHWLDTLPKLKRQLGFALSVEAFARVNISLFNALAYRRSDSPALPDVEKKLRQLMLLAPDPNARFMLGAHLVRYYTWAGDIPAMQSVMNRLRSQLKHPELAPFTRLVWAGMTAACSWQIDSAEAGLEAAERGLALARETGLHLLDLAFLVQGAYCAFITGDLERVETYVEQMPETYRPERLVDMGHATMVRGWLQLARGEIDAAAASIAEAQEIAKIVGSPYVSGRIFHVVAQLQFRQGRFAEANENLDAATEIGLRHRFPLLRYIAMLARAEIAFADSKPDTGLALLADALEQGRQRGYQNFPHWTPPQLAALCARALAGDIETTYVRAIVLGQRLPPPTGLDEFTSVRWPWAVRVRCLGSFELRVDDAVQTARGKTQQKPLALLKLLIARGGVRVPSTALAAELWPDAEGDGARDALKTTLARLRKLIGADVVVLSDGSLSLSTDRVHVDALALEPKLDRLLQGADVELAEQALELYRGALLPSEDAAWVLGPRERLRDRFVRAIEVAGRQHLESGRADDAAELFARAIEVEERAEPLYLGLIEAQLARGREHEALRSYERCARVLAGAGAFTPSPSLAALVARLRSP